MLAIAVVEFAAQAYKIGALFTQPTRLAKFKYFD